MVWGRALGTKLTVGEVFGALGGGGGREEGGEKRGDEM